MKKKKPIKSLMPRRGAESVLGFGTEAHTPKKGPGSYKRQKGSNFMKELDESNKFRKYFSLVLEQGTPPPPPPTEGEEAETPAEEATPADDQAALEKGLEADTKATDFDVEPMDIGAQTNKVQKLVEFIKKIEEFSKFLNSESGESINKFINEIDKEGSVLKGISRESSKVTTVAENLASLAEAFRGQILVALRKHRENKAATEEY